MEAFKFIQNNWAVIATILFLLSELLAQIPRVKANSVFQLIFGFLKKEKEEAEKRASQASADRFDIVVAGGGHNSLVTAAYLSKAGYRCMVLEGRPLLGGGVKTAELMLKGFHDDVCSSAHSFLMDNPMMRNNELRLGDYGLEYIDPDPIFHVPFADGIYLTQWRDLIAPAKSLPNFPRKMRTLTGKCWRSSTPLNLW